MDDLKKENQLVSDDIGVSNKWVNKYSPNTLDDIVLNDDVKTMFRNMVNSKHYVNMTLIGSPGIGKTTVAKTLTHEANGTVLFMACSTGDGKIDAIHTKLLPFIQSMPIDDSPMFVILDELDSASSSGDSNFQKALRNAIESAPHVTFICTANYNKIIPAVTSRCPIINIGYSKEDLIKRLTCILNTEHIKYTNSSLQIFVDSIFDKYYPDIRAIINQLQILCSTGELLFSKENGDGNAAIIASLHGHVATEQDTFIQELVDFAITEKTSVLSLRQYYISKKSLIANDYIDVASKIFNYIIDTGIINSPATILKMSNIIYQLNIVLDKEIQFFALLVCINESTKK